MSGAFWTDEANADLMGIVTYIGVQHGRRHVARAIYDEIKAACSRRARYPLTGQAYPELGADVRGFAHKRWLILYRATSDGITVLAVVDSARELTAFFGRRPLPPDSGGGA